MSTRLQQILPTGSVNAGATAVLNHGLNINGVAVLADEVAFDNADFDFVSMTTTTITVVNRGSAAQSANVRLIYFHSILRAYGSSLTTALSPRPFVIRGGAAQFVSVDSIADLRTVQGSINGQLIELTGYYAVGDGGGGTFWWENGVTVGDNGGTIIVPSVAPTGRWVRLYEPGIVNVLWFGAQPGLGALVPQQAFFTAALAIFGQTGGTLIVPKGRYGITATIEIGAAGSPAQGVVIEGASRAKAYTGGTLLTWYGASGAGPILRIRNASTGALRDISFDGNALASYCVQFNAVLGDVDNVTQWTCDGVRFGDARTANVLIGEAAGASTGDNSNITFDTCYFNQAFLGAPTVAHVLHRASETFGTTFVDCRFVGDPIVGGRPLHAIKMEGGSIVVIGGSFETVGGPAVLLSGQTGIPFPGICIYGTECQSTEQLLETQFVASGAAAGLHPVVLSGLAQSDIVGGVAADAVIWDVDIHAPLTVTGCRFQGNLAINNVNARVFVDGLYFDNVTGNITGTGAARVAGSWWKNAAFKHRFPDLPEFANNAAALAGGLIVGDLYRITGGGDVQVVI